MDNGLTIFNWTDLLKYYDLKKELIHNTPFSQIAISHKRSEKAIELQGLNLANKFVTTKLKDKEVLVYNFCTDHLGGDDWKRLWKKKFDFFLKRPPLKF